MKMEFKSSYISAKEVEKGAVIEILDPGKEQESKFTYENGDPKTDYIFRVMYKGEEKNLRMNTTSRRAMCEAFGFETTDWVGKKAKIQLIPTPKGDNKMIALDPITDDWGEEE